MKSCPANEWGWNRLIKTGTSGNQNTALQSTPRPKVESFRKISSSCCNLGRIILIIRRKYNFSTKVESNLICFASRWIYNLSIIKGELWPSAIIYVIHPLWIKEWRNFEGQLSSLIWGNNFAWGGWCEREGTLLINRAAAFVPQLALLPKGVSQKARIRNSKLGQNYSSSPHGEGAGGSGSKFDQNLSLRFLSKLKAAGCLKFEVLKLGDEILLQKTAFSLVKSWLALGSPGCLVGCSFGWL